MSAKLSRAPDYQVLD